jgi:hypothetical protein
MRRIVVSGFATLEGMIDAPGTKSTGMARTAERCGDLVSPIA